MRQDYYLCSGRGQKVYFSLPPQWTPSHFIEDEEDVPIPSVAQMTEEALTTPLGTPPLKNLVFGANRIAIIIDDWTRPTPVAEILQVLLPYLVRNGFPREKVTIVVALGTHSAMTGDELEARVGRETASSYKIIQHNAWQSDLVPVTLPEDGSDRKNQSGSRSGRRENRDQFHLTSSNGRFRGGTKNFDARSIRF